MKQTILNGESVFMCEECGFHYREAATAERCEEWCREHQSCNLKIIQKAVEHEGQ